MAPKKRPVKQPVKRRGAAEVPAEGLRLWAPWRYAYLRSLLSDPHECIFCFGGLSEIERRQRLVVFENRDVLVMLNKYPYNNGHIMVAPRSHVASPELLPRSERALLADAVAASIRLMRETLHPAGVQRRRQPGRRGGCRDSPIICIGMSCRAGRGDNNFMPVLASTRVLSQSLEEGYEQLRPIFKNLGAELS